jgi:hypothetical protein
MSRRVSQLSWLLAFGLGLAGCGPKATTFASATPTEVIPATATLRPLAVTPSVPTIATIQPTGATPPFVGTLLIADAGNDRLLEVGVDKRIVWSFPVAGSLPPGRVFRYPDDAFFSPDGSLISINEESNEVVSLIDYASRKLVWEFGVPGVPGSDLRHLNTPDDAHILPDGRIVVADIKNCRLLLIVREPLQVTPIGRANDCSGKPGSFAKPNGVTPMANGHLLVTEITIPRISEIDERGTVIRSVNLPILYPSDAFLTPRDTIIVASYTHAGRVIEVDWSGRVLWSFPPAGGREWLNRSSIAIELPNGNIAIVDDHRHRVLVVDRAGAVLWQYGVTDHPGTDAGYLTIPDGIDWHAP